MIPLENDTREILVKKGLLKIGECECCPQKDVEIAVRYGNLWMCDNCWTKDKELTALNNTPAAIEARVTEANNKMAIAIEASKIIDNSITISSDIFNSETVAIIDLKKLIDADESITNKPYALAEMLTNRFQKDKQVIFEASQVVMEAGNRQKAIQTYLNTLANKLRADEREKLKITDINYQPSKVKSVTPKVIKTKSANKIDKKAVKFYAKQLGVGEYMIQMLCVSKGVSPEEASKIIKASIETAKGISEVK